MYAAASLPEEVVGLGLRMQSLTPLESEFRGKWKAGENEGFSPRIERKMPRQDPECLVDAKAEAVRQMVPSSPPTSLLLSSSRSLSTRVLSVIEEARRLFDGTSGPALEKLNLGTLRERLGALRPEDVAGERLGMLSKGEVGYVSLEDNVNFTIGVFFLAPGARIPLHDHPEMCVLSHVTKGKVHVTSYDFDLSSANNMAYLVDDAMYSAPNTRTLYPTSGGNLHTFATKTGCIIVYVMSPPYDEMDGRECTYFRASRVHNAMYKVEKTLPPDDFEVLDLSQ